MMYFCNVCYTLFYINKFSMYLVSCILYLLAGFSNYVTTTSIMFNIILTDGSMIRVEIVAINDYDYYEIS